MSKALSWLPVGEMLAASQWDHNRAPGHRNQRACSAVWPASISLKSAVGPGLGAPCCPGPCVSHSLECPSPPRLWAAPFPGTGQGGTLATQPGGLHALHLYRAPLPHILGTDRALWVRMETSAPQGVLGLPTTPNLLGQGVAWKESWQLWGFLSVSQARRRYLVCLCLPALPFFILYTETTLWTAGEEEEVQRGPGFQGCG